MKVELGKLEVGIAIMTIVLSGLGSWIATREQMATYMERSSAVEHRVASNTASIVMLTDSLRETRTEVLILRERGNQLSQSTKEYKETLDKLGVVLVDLNTTLVRMDERFKGLDQNVQELKAKLP